MPRGARARAMAEMGKFRGSSLGLLELLKLAVCQPMLMGLLDRHTHGIENIILQHACPAH